MGLNTVDNVVVMRPSGRARRIYVTRLVIVVLVGGGRVPAVRARRIYIARLVIVVLVGGSQVLAVRASRR